MSLAFISLGCNIGDCHENLTGAWRLLGETKEITVLALSDPYITRPIIKTEWRKKGKKISDAPFTNAVGVLETTLAPHALLKATSDIELKLGRDRNNTVDRTLDLDLIYYDDLILSDETLTIPHPEMHKRHFVLTPLAELAPDRVHPVTCMSTSDMLRSLPVADNDLVSRTNWESEEASR